MRGPTLGKEWGPKSGRANGKVSAPKMTQALDLDEGPTHYCKLCGTTVTIFIRERLHQGGMQHIFVHSKHRCIGRGNDMVRPYKGDVECVNRPCACVGSVKSAMASGQFECVGLGGSSARARKKGSASSLGNKAPPISKK